MRRDLSRITAVNVGKQSRWLTRALGRGGTSFPGLLAERIDPGVVGALVAELPHGCVVISGTNGKTTTTRILVDAAERFGWTVISNREGSNLSRGIGSVLLDHADHRGRLQVSPDAIGVFEVDEGALPMVLRSLRPRLVVFTNLFRDQLDRYFELDFVAHLWRRALTSLTDQATVVLNADDPQVASLADATEAGTLYYGLDDLRHGQEGLEHAADSRRCPRCDTDLLYERTFYAHLGHYACGKCGWRRPPVGVSGSRVELSDSDGAELEATTPCGNQLLHVPLGGLYNIYNALAAVAGAYALGVDPVAVEQAVAAATAAFGRLERFQVRGRQVCLIIVKNPTGFNQALRLVLGDGDREIDGLLLALNDNGPDGRDVSWIWDVDFELLAHRPPGRMTLSGTRTHDLALRLKYAGVPTAAPDGEIPALHLDEDVVRAFWSAVGQVPPGGTLYVLPTYTAMWTLRDRLAREGYVKPFWQEARPAARQP